MKKKDRKPVDVRRHVYRALVIGMLCIVSAVALLSGWYALYTGIMPAVNSFLFGFVGGANSFASVEETVIPYTLVALWGIPALLLCATLNVVAWKVTVLWMKGVRKVYRFALNKFDENTAKVTAGKGGK